MNEHRDLLDILNTPGYVSIIEGEPGSGKTTLALKACARHGNATYISYADPEVSITRKLKVVEPRFKGPFKVVSMLSGKPDSVFSLIEEAGAGRSLSLLIRLMRCSTG